MELIRWSENRLLHSQLLDKLETPKHNKKCLLRCVKIDEVVIRSFSSSIRLVVNELGPQPGALSLDSHPLLLFLNVNYKNTLGVAFHLLHQKSRPLPPHSSPLRINGLCSAEKTASQKPPGKVEFVPHAGKSERTSAVPGWGQRSANFCQGFILKSWIFLNKVACSHIHRSVFFPSLHWVVLLIYRVCG